MGKLCMFLIFGLVASQTASMYTRERRQAGNNNTPNRSTDRFPIQNVFPEQNPFDDNMNIDIIDFLNQAQIGNQGQTNQQQQTSSTTLAPNNGQVAASMQQQCIRNCPVTSEYNPVCGTDNVTYTNPGRLTCAQSCGINVSLARQSPCPRANPVVN
uniref:Protease inhibitor 1 n=1 Tax=Lonomia obliqua TaxID=304329 RepID=Q5MGH6_LONON|nr:protease inhibitor 1 [Lonomia obliqua]